MKNLIMFVGILTLALTSVAEAKTYSVKMKCNTTKGPWVGYNPDGGTFHVESLSEGNTAPIWTVLGVHGPSSAYEVSTDSKLSGRPGFIQFMVLTDATVQFMKTPTFVKDEDGWFYATSAQFKINSKMKNNVADSIATSAKALTQAGYNNSDLQSFKAEANKLIDATLADPGYDSEVICSMVGSYK